MSLQTTLARAEARAAEDKWADHRNGCPPCSRWRKRQKGQRPCETGLHLFQDYDTTRHDYEKEKHLDAQPWPGQVSLFPELPCPPKPSRKDHP